MKRPVVDQNTVLALVGLVALAVGVALVSVPGSLIVVGGLLLAYAILPDQSPGGPPQ